MRAMIAFAAALCSLSVVLADDPAWLGRYALLYDAAAPRFIELKDDVAVSLTRTNGIQVSGRFQHGESGTCSVFVGSKRIEIARADLVAESRGRCWREDFAHLAALGELVKAGVVNRDQAAQVDRAFIRMMASQELQRYKVTQVLPVGVLAVPWEGTYGDTDVDKWGAPFFIECETSGLADGDIKERVTLWPVGSFQYRSLKGSDKTVRRYTANRGRALSVSMSAP